jgi:hypothetical protein
MIVVKMVVVKYRDIVEKLMKKFFLKKFTFVKLCQPKLDLVEIIEISNS